MISKLWEFFTGAAWGFESSDTHWLLEERNFCGHSGVLLLEITKEFTKQVYFVKSFCDELAVLQGGNNRGDISSICEVFQLIQVV